MYFMNNPSILNILWTSFKRYFECQFQKSEKSSTHVSSCRYEYVCCDLPVKCQSHKKIATQWDDANNGDARYLDRHNVNCGTDSFMSAFKLNQQGSGRIRYNADCCRIPDKKSCYPAKTPFNDDGRGNTVYLDRHNVACRDNYAVSRFRMVRNDKGDKVQYHFTCCTVKEIIKRKFFFLIN